MSSQSQYLLALYIAEQRGEPPTSSGDVASLLDRSPASATEMFGRLAEAGLVEYEPYRGATLTDDGRAQASEYHRTYVALSWYFRSVLELDDYEREALEIAGLLDPVVGERLAEALPIE